MGNLIMAASGSGATGTSVTDALTTIGDLVTTCMGVVTGNSVLMIMFCGGLMGIGFTLIKKAKKAAK